MIYFERVASLLGRPPDESLFEKLRKVIMRSLEIMLIFGVLMQIYLRALCYLVRQEIEWKQSQLNATRTPRTRQELLQELERGDVKIVEPDG